TEYDELHAIGNERLQNVVTVGKQFANGVIRLEQRSVADLSSDDCELAGPYEFGVVRIDFELCRWRRDSGQLLQPCVTPILFRAEVEGGPDQFVALRIIDLELFARADGAVVPVVDAVAIEVRLANLRPEFAGIGACVSIFPKPFVDSLAVSGVPAVAPGRVH